jgi:hypothetical protein
MKYFNRFNEEELLHQITRLEDINQTGRQESSRLTDVSLSSFAVALVIDMRDISHGLDWAHQKGSAA